MDEVMPMTERIIVGKVCNRPWGYQALSRWMQDTWGGHLQNLPQLLLLARGWLGFITSRKEDAEWILGQYWDVVGSLLHLQRWSPLFDDHTAVVDFEPVWV